MFIKTLSHKYKQSKMNHMRNLISQFNILRYLYDMIYNYMYQYIIGNKKNNLSTPYLFLHSIQEIKEGSKILDFGCGNCLVYENEQVMEHIKTKNLKIIGIDIDESYIGYSKKLIKKINLDSHIEVKLENIFKCYIENENHKFDYIIFSESAPLMTKIEIQNIVNHMYNNLLKSNGSIIFINNLSSYDNCILKYGKPLLKYITMVDFGRVLTKGEFIELAERFDKKIKFNVIVSNKCSQLFKLLNKQWCFRILQFFGFKDYDVEQYQIILD